MERPTDCTYCHKPLTIGDYALACRDGDYAHTKCIIKRVKADVRKQWRARQAKAVEVK